MAVKIMNDSQPSSPAADGNAATHTTTEQKAATPLTLSPLATPATTTKHEPRIIKDGSITRIDY